MSGPIRLALWSLASIMSPMMVTSHYARGLKLDFLCSGSHDGLYVRDVPWDCSSYVICMNGQAIPTVCPQGYHYHTDSHTCGPGTSSDSSRCHGVIWRHIHTICYLNPASTLPDAGKCSQYYDCSVGSSGHEYIEFLLECPYPTLYCTETGSCRHYRYVMCGSRSEPKAPCEYTQYQQIYNCSGARCPVCDSHHPSCVGLSNGQHPATTGSDIIMECEGERTLNIVFPESSLRPKQNKTTSLPGT